ncbi:hypothetical protein LTR36_009750 [Oleoguttula mirabilis]|uniref:DUF7053 domain-containing protein n=1 Tax=Oleoguttula mirabilis TaxID=1507867 RepID=A0AAV9J5C1_9PEZI|nr:hypothetical protein LTR36_009750 [Oleoguttula mirabilis]
MSKRSFITNITPLPPSITRSVALAYLHDHIEMIELNPLVVRHQTTTAPPNATLEEQVNCRWYEITDVINYLPGGAAKSEVSYKGGFYDLEYGLQTHVFAPAGVDLKALWRVAGNMPGEPAEPPELGVNIPKSGLYLREDIELRCNVFLMNFVKRNLKKSHAKLVGDLVSKANDPRYLKTRTAAETSTRASESTRSPDERSSGGSMEQRSTYSTAASSLSPQSTQTSRQDTPHEQSEPCSCARGSHHVMCPNYRYNPALSTRQSNSSQPTVRSELGAPYRPTTNSTANSADTYSPAGAHPDLAHAPSSSQTGLYQGYQPPRHAAQPRYNKPLPAGPPGSTSKGLYSSPQLFGEQAELPSGTTSGERDQVGSSGATAAVSELDGTGVAYWQQRPDLLELE